MSISWNSNLFFIHSKCIKPPRVAAYFFTMFLLFNIFNCCGVSSFFFFVIVISWSSWSCCWSIISLSFIINISFIISPAFFIWSGPCFLGAPELRSRSYFLERSPWNVKRTRRRVLLFRVVIDIIIIISLYILYHFFIYFRTV